LWQGHLQDLRHSAIAVPDADEGNCLDRKISADISNARSRVAKALNNHGIPTRSRTGDKFWTSSEVAERVKQQEPRMVRVPGSSLQDARRALVEKWNALYYPIPSPAASNVTKIDANGRRTT
jgi:hypothetical protein